MLTRLSPHEEPGDGGLPTNSAPAMIRESGPDGLCNYCDQGWLSYTGRAAQQELGMGWMQSVHPNDAVRCLEIITSCFRKRCSFRMEYRLRRCDGQYRWVLETQVPRSTSAGEFLGYFTTCLDVHDLKVAGDSLRDSEVRYRTLFETTQDGILIVNNAGRYVEVNKSFCDILHARREQLIGAHFSAFIPPDRLAEAETAFAQLQAGGETPIDFPLRSLDGSIVELEWSTAADYLPGLYFCVCRDITARKRLEAANLHMAAIVESSDDAIVSKDLQGIITSWNKAAERMFGYSVDEAVGKPISMLAPPGRKDEMPKILARIRRGERVDHFETVRRTKQGRDLEVSVTVSPVRDKHGNIIGASKISRDITKQKQAQLELKASNAALRRINEHLRDFAYVAGHDLKEPLRAVTVYSELLARRCEGKIDAETDQFIAFIKDGAKQVAEMLSSLAAFTQANEILEQSPEPVDCNEAVGMAIENLRTAVNESGAEIEIAKLPVVLAHKAHLVQVFQNLIANAVKYKKAEVNPKVQIFADERATDWVLSVKDNGIGVDPQQHDRIFEAFQRLHTHEYPGTGMGLAICARLIERNGGAIWVNSQPGHGATFCFTLPKPGLY